MIVDQQPIPAAENTADPAVAKKFPRLSALQFGCALLALVLAWLGALVMALIGVFQAFTGGAGADTLYALLNAASLFGIGLLLIPSIYYGLFRLLDRPAYDLRPLIRRLRPSRWLLIFPIILLVGVLSAQIPPLAWLALPALHVFALGIPIAWIVSLAVRDLPTGSAQRMWGVFNSGLTLAPLVIIILEILAVLGVAGVAAVYLIGRPEILSVLQELVQSASYSQPDEAEVMRQLGPYILRPGVIFGALAVMSVLVPLIEEALKPVGVWLLAGRPLGAAAGFTAGVLSGAGFALTESLLLSSSSGGTGSLAGDWAILVLVRMGTGAIHIFTASLTGWALAVAWKRGKYGLLGLSYLTAVTIHGLWNGLTIVTVFAGLSQLPGAENAPVWVNRLAVAAPLTLVVLAFGALFLLWFFNRKLRMAANRRKAAGGEPAAA